MSREALVQDRLRDVIQKLAENFRFEGIKISRIERDYQVKIEKLRREVDLALLMENLMPFMFIETKRKADGKPSIFSHPLDISSVGQAVSYAAIYKRSEGIVVPFVAIANPDRIAVFETPQDIDEYVNWEAIHQRRYEDVLDRSRYQALLDRLVWDDKMEFDEEYIYSLLRKCAKIYLGAKEIKVKPTQALINRLREFVYWVAGRLEPKLQLEITRDPIRSELRRFGYNLDGNLPQLARNLSRMMSYVLLNKILFYKLLERTYHLPPLRLSTESLERFKQDIDYYFRHAAIEKTRDFEPIFITGIYDLIPWPDDLRLREYINSLIETLDKVDLSGMEEHIGYIYEELIPPEGRHQLGQFYT